MPVEITALSEFDDPGAALSTYHRVDAAAFGLAPDPAQLDSKRPLIEFERWFLASIDGEPCGGAGSFPVELTLPGGHMVAVSAVSDIGVLPTHRRRGVLSALMRRQLQDFVERGAPLAVLHASEAGIYRRFGFGPATRWRVVRADARRVAFRDDWPDPGGSVSMLAKSDAHAVCSAVHDRVRRSVVGGVSRSDAWWDVVLGDVESYIGGSARHLVMAHRDQMARGDGYAIYEITEDWTQGQANHELTVWELVGESPGIELALWSTLLSHDLVATVAGPIAVDHVLWDVVADARQLSVAWDQDLLWARVLDVGATLSTRRYAESGAVVLEVIDDVVPAVGGRYRLMVESEGVGVCERTSAAPHLTIDVSDLGACVLGGSSFRRLERAGRIDAAPGAALLADRLFAVDPLPWCWVRF